MALTRVASADQVVTEQETHAIQRILNETSDLAPGEVELVMALSRSLVGIDDSPDGDSALGRLDPDRHRHFVAALRAVAEADGAVSIEEEREIATILGELGLGE